MPNPYQGNDEAAYFLEYYGSKRMLQDSVDRLYKGGVEQRKAAEEKVKKEVYPPLPTPRRTQAEIDAYLQSRVEGELFRRQQHRAALQRELYPEVESPGKVLSRSEVDRLVKHVYRDPMRQRSLRRQEIVRIFGENKKSLSPSRKPEEEALLREREARWRPPSVAMKYDDNQRVLVSQYEYYASPRQANELMLKEKKGSGPQARKANLARLTELAKPLSITPKRAEEEPAPGSPPPFHVSPKVDHTTTWRLR